MSIKTDVVDTLSIDWNRGSLRDRLPVYRLGSIVLIVTVWHVLASQVPASTFPNIPQLATTLWEVARVEGERNIYTNTRVTFYRILLTFLITMPLGMAIGTAMGLSWRVESFVSPYVAFSLAFPSIVWAFLGVLWFGLTKNLVPVFVGVLITLPYVVINTWEGTKNLDDKLLEMSRSYEASRLQMARYVLIPHLSPYTFALMRIVLPIAWKIMLVAEIFGAQSGLGFVINELFFAQRNDLIIAWTVPALVLVFLLERGIRYLERRRFAWRDDTDDIAQVGGG
jgi:NitT/TauT family transport system permease protein